MSTIEKAKFSVHVEVVSGRDPILGFASLKVVGHFHFDGRIIEGAFTISGFRVMKGNNFRTKEELWVAPPSRPPKNSGGKANSYFFAFAYGPQDETKELWYAVEDLIIETYLKTVGDEPAKASQPNESEEVNIDDVPF